MSKFNLNTSATLKKLIPKLSKSNDILSLELHFKGAVCLMAACAAATLAKDHEEFERAWFKPKAEDVNRNLRFFGIKEIPCDSNFEARHMVTLTDELLPIRAARVGRIILRPQPGAACFADFMVVLEKPEPEVSEILMHKIGHTIPIVLDQERDLVDEMAAAKQGMAATTTVPDNGQLNLERDTNQLNQAADGLAANEPKAAKKRAAKKSAKKRAPKKATP